jgi:hypothetical protein
MLLFAHRNSSCVIPRSKHVLGHSGSAGMSQNVFRTVLERQRKVFPDPEGTQKVFQTFRKTCLKRFFSVLFFRSKSGLSEAITLQLLK